MQKKGTPGWGSVAIGVGAALITSAAWLMVLRLVLMAGSAAVSPAALAVARAMGRVMLALTLDLWPILPVSAFAGIMLALAARPRAAAKEEVGHA